MEVHTADLSVNAHFDRMFDRKPHRHVGQMRRPVSLDISYLARTTKASTVTPAAITRAWKVALLPKPHMLAPVLSIAFFASWGQAYQSCSPS